MAGVSRRRISRCFRAALLVSLVIGTDPAASAATTREQQPTFATPEQAIEALVTAVRASRTDKLFTLLGPGSRKLIRSGDAVADAQARSRFLAAYQESNKIKQQSEGQVALLVGKDDWTFPFPVVKNGKRWKFDSRAGAEEILDRRIGANELDAIEVCHAYVDAQHEYAGKDRNHDGFLEYAQQFLSTPGKQDGLYWPAAAGEKESPMGPLMVRARAEGYGATTQGARRPYHGYYYRILKGQGPAAKGGAYDYVVNGHMIGGFALIAFPAQYGASGVMTFIVNHDGVVYQKDLGPNTASLAAEITRFDPDPTWKPS